MATIKDISEKLGLSQATISRALRNDETLSITSETRSKILQTAEELGYVKSVRKTTTKKDKNILVIHAYNLFGNQMNTSYFYSIRSGIEANCSKEHIQCLFMTLEDFHFIETSIHGIILLGNCRKEVYDLILSTYKNIPVTVIGIVSYYRNIVDQVSYRNYDTVLMALNYLFEMGHTKIGYIGASELAGTEEFGSRIGSFEQIMTQKGLLTENWIHILSHDGRHVEAGYRFATTLAEKKEALPTAYYCANDPLALGLIKGLTDNGIKIPDDISIISQDGAYQTQYSVPSLTTIDVHTYELGLEAVNCLIRRFSEPHSTAKQILLFPTLEIRGSVKSL